MDEQHDDRVDRAQLPSTQVFLPVLICIIVVAMVFHEALSHSPPVDATGVENVCLGMCGCGPCPTWWYVAAAGLLVALVAAVAVGYQRGDSA